MVHKVNNRLEHVDCVNHPEGHERSVFDVARTDTGEIVETRRQHMWGPVGSMWFERWGETNRPTGPDDWDHPDFIRTDPSTQRQPSHTFIDGWHLVVITPGGKWVIDSRASNCGSPWDYEHRCWVRHGQPPNITVNKAGLTCQAGAGSIQCCSYHGFLRDGELTDC